MDLVMQSLTLWLKQPSRGFNFNWMVFPSMPMAYHGIPWLRGFSSHFQDIASVDDSAEVLEPEVAMAPDLSVGWMATLSPNPASALEVPLEEDEGQLG